MEVLPSCKLQDHAYEYYNPFGLKEDNLSQRNFQNQLSHIQVCFTQSKNVKRVWFEEILAINNIQAKASNIGKAKI